MASFSEKALIAIAAGGSGGHVFPAEATARALVALGCAVVFLTDNRGKAFSGDLAEVPVIHLPAARIGKGLSGKISTILNTLKATTAALRFLRRQKPAAVVGFGGYPTVAPLLAALLLRVPIVLHDQNAVLGRANKLFAPFSRLVAASFPSLYGAKAMALSRRVTLTGNPVRPEIRALYDKPYALPQDGRFKLLVTGGSQGAHVFSEIVPAAIRLLPQDLRDRLDIAQQCRAEDLTRAQEVYASIGMTPVLASFFRDIPDRLTSAHLVIARSGASTIAELAVVGRPAILVPLPHAITGEQLANAEALANVGGAWIMPERAFTPEALAARLESLLRAPESLQKAALAAKSIAVPDAAVLLANAVIEAARPTAGEPKSTEPASKDAEISATTYMKEAP